jgi:hypothetical protein
LNRCKGINSFSFVDYFKRLFPSKRKEKRLKSIRNQPF